MRGDHLLQVRHPTFDLGHAVAHRGEHIEACG